MFFDGMRLNKSLNLSRDFFLVLPVDVVVEETFSVTCQNVDQLSLGFRT
jgi:hypothetical protein